MPATTEVYIACVLCISTSLHNVAITTLLFMQYAELAFTMYEGYSYYAGILLAITLISGFMSTIIAYRSRLQLYNSIAQCRLLPLVHKGYVRYMSPELLLDMMQPSAIFIGIGAAVML